MVLVRCIETRLLDSAPLGFARHLAATGQQVLVWFDGYATKLLEEKSVAIQRCRGCILGLDKCVPREAMTRRCR